MPYVRKYVMSVGQCHPLYAHGGVSRTKLLPYREFLCPKTPQLTQKGLDPMKQSRAIQPHKRHYIPYPYYEPAKFAMKLHGKAGFHLADAVQTAYDSFTDPKNKDHVKNLNIETLRKHILSYYCTD